MAVLRSHLGLPGALMGELAEHSGDLLAEHGLRRGVGSGVMGKLVERAGDLLLVLRGELLRCRERLAETLLLQALIAVALPLVAVTRLSRVAAGPGAVIALARLSERALSELALSELALSKLALSKLAEAWVAELGAEPLGSSVAHHSGRPEDRGRQRLSEIRRMVSVRQ
jgi:predicted nucleic acid-binding Zn ribbon protein